MTPHSAPHPRNDLNPAMEALIRAADPADGEKTPGMERSRANTSGIPAGKYAPSISQSAVTPNHPVTQGVFASDSIHRSGTLGSTRRRNTLFALAASAALVAGVAVFGPWANNPAPSPGPAAPVPAPAPAPAVTTAPHAAPSYFNPLNQQKMSAFHGAGGEIMVGRLRAALPEDPARLQATGWVFELYSKSGTTPTAELTPDDKADDAILINSAWVPIDLKGRSTSLLGHTPETGDLVIVYSTNLRDGILEPESGPYGVLVSDPALLAQGTLRTTESAMTLDGEQLGATDEDLNVSYLVQHAAFGMKFGYSGTTEQVPTAVRAKSFYSQTGSDARSCVAIATAAGDRILSFPVGTTASIDMIDIEGDPLVMNTPLRMTPPVQPGQRYNTADFSLDTTRLGPTMLTVWPTGATGTCGDRSGEIVKFAGIKK